MSRKKVKLQWIANDAARRATFKKRRRGLMKKVQELSVLCNIRACAVVYGPYEPQPEVWPGPDEAAALLRGFRGMPEHEQGRRRMDQEGFLRQRTEKLREQIEKEKKAAREIRVELLMSDCLKGAARVDDLGMEETTTLGCLVEMKLKEVQARIEFLRGDHQIINTADVVGAAAAMGVISPPLPAFNFKHDSPPPPPLVLPNFPPPPQPAMQQYQLPASYLLQLPPVQAPLMEVAVSHKLPDQLHAPTTTTAGGGGRAAAQSMNFADQTTAAAEGIGRTDWFMEMMGPYSHLLYEGDQILAPPPLMDEARNPWMMDPYFSFN